MNLPLNRVPAWFPPRALPLLLRGPAELSSGKSSRFGGLYGVPGSGGSGRTHEYKHAQGIQQARRDKPDLFRARGYWFHSAMKVLRGAGFVEVLALVMIEAPHTSQD